MPARRPPTPEPPKKRRRYDEGAPQKLYDDLRLYVAAKGRGYLPTPSELYRDDYSNIGWALLRRGYLLAVEETGLARQPDYFGRPENVREEIERLFVDPQWQDHENDSGFEAKLPDYEALRSHPELHDAVCRLGGMAAIYPPNRTYGPKMTGEYYASEENLRAELGIQMKALRTKNLPTYVQLESRNELLAEAYLVRGGYAATAETLGIPFQVGYLKDVRNLARELDLIAIQEARKEGEAANESGLPDYFQYWMPTQREIRRIRRPDLHKAIESVHGGYHHAAAAMGLHLHAHFWERNPSLKAEMRRAARLVGSPKFMPDTEDLREIDRADLVKAIAQHGGYRKTAALVGLEAKKPQRLSERPLRANGPDAGRLVAYPFRRFDPKMTTNLDGVSLGFEVPSDLKKGSPAEYGVWILMGEATLGRIGRIRLRLRSKDVWLYRVEGEPTWRGTFEILSMNESIRQLFSQAGVAGDSP